MASAPGGFTLVGQSQSRVAITSQPISPVSATAHPNYASTAGGSVPASPQTINQSVHSKGGEKGKGKGALLGKDDGRPIGLEEAKKGQGLDKKALSIDLLLVGYVQSFIDFFYISHRKPQSTLESGPVQDADGEMHQDVSIPEDTMTFLKQTLESAETARRQKNFHHCFEHYNLLSDYFEKINDLKGAKYFYERCAAVATEVQAQESIAKAKVSLGTVEEKAKNWKEAQKFFEEAFDIALACDSLPLQMKISVRLTHLYFVLAEQCEQESNDVKANVYYKQALTAAQKTKDSHVEGMACHLLGKSHYKMKNYDQAINLQLEYLNICRQSDDRTSEAMARGALAKCYEATGDISQSIKQLETLLNVASEAGEFHAQASACLNLGLLYHCRNEYDKSVELLEQHFDLARQLGDRKLIDSARVILGMARGNGKLDVYATLVNTNMEKLLKWKAKRTPLDN